MEVPLVLQVLERATLLYHPKSMCLHLICDKKISFQLTKFNNDYTTQWCGVVVAVVAVNTGNAVIEVT